MNILFFGGTSFVASDLIDSLSLKYNVYNISRRKLTNTKNIYLDFNDKNSFKNLNKIRSKKIEYIFFFTSYVPQNEKQSTWDDCKDLNVYSCIRLLEKINLKVNKFILASSTSIYGQQKKLNIRENNFLSPDSGYALSKFSQEHIFRIFCYKKNIDFLNLRFGYVYSKNMNSERLIIKIFNKIKNNEDVDIYNGSKINLNLIHTSDIVKIINKLMLKNVGTFNICSSKFITLEYYIDQLINIFPNYNGKIRYINESNVNKMNSYSIKKLKKYYKISNLTSMKKQLKKMKFLL